MIDKTFTTNALKKINIFVDNLKTNAFKKYLAQNLNYYYSFNLIYIYLFV